MNFSLAAEKITPATVIYCGAHKGHGHNEARLHWPNSHFILIEGNAANETELRKTGAETHIAILSDAIKPVTFYTRKDAPQGATGDSLYRESTKFYSDDNTEATELQATTLDELFKDRILDMPILLLMDLQGAELDAMNGAIQLMRAVSAVVMEVSLEQYNSGSPLFPEVDSYMRKWGFRMECELGEITHPIHGHIIQRDVLYVR